MRWRTAPGLLQLLSTWPQVRVLPGALSASGLPVPRIAVLPPERSAQKPDPLAPCRSAGTAWSGRRRSRGVARAVPPSARSRWTYGWVAVAPEIIPSGSARPSLPSGPGPRVARGHPAHRPSPPGAGPRPAADLVLGARLAQDER